ncbi:MAG: DUF5615 family PIN-like protein [Cyanobacteria bacterium P01_A01_bin.17]
MSFSSNTHYRLNRANSLSNDSGLVVTTSGENLIGASDEEQLAFALSQDRVIFTQDDDFLRLHQSGIEHSGIAYCHQGSHSLGDIVQILAFSKTP